MARRSAPVPLAALLVLGLTSAAPAAEPAPEPRALYPRFDLTYFPKVGGQGVIGIRPAEIARYATPAEVKQAGRLMLGVLSGALGGWNLDAGDPPSLAELDQCVLCLRAQFTAPHGKEKASFILGGATPGTIRTVRPYDWNGLLRKWFPKATAARHAGRPYLRVALQPVVTLPTDPPALPMAAYTPDDRTLVLGTEDEVRSLLDRLAAGGPAPEGPPGWREVDRDFAAFALDNRAEPLVVGRFPRGYVAAKEVGTLSRSLQTLAAGFAVGERTRLRLVATARNDAHARATAGALRGLFRAAADGAAAEGDADPLDAFAAELLRSATLDHAGRRVIGSLSADGNVVKLLLAVLRGFV